MEDNTYIEQFLKASASPELVVVIRRAIERAKAGNNETHLAHLALELLGDPTAQARISAGTKSKASAALAEQTLGFRTAPASRAKFAFRLAILIEPARELARDWGAERVSPLSFLATCLVAGIPLDPISQRTQEILRAAGLTVESLMPAAGTEDLRRQDFTFKSLGFGTDLTAMSAAGFWPDCPVVGMAAQLRTLAKLLNSGVGSAVIVGEPGVGKSAFIQGFAYKIAHRDRRLIPGTMDSWTIVMIEAADIFQGTGARGDLEGRVKEMLVFFKKNPTVVPFFEEIHRLLDNDDPNVRSVATALKPPMANGLFRCVGATTDKEYARFIACDDAMNSRFRKILLPEPDQKTAVDIVEGSKVHLLRGRALDLGVSISGGAVGGAVRITSLYQRSDRLPRKALNLLSATVSEKVYEVDMASTESVSRVVTESDVARLFSEVSGIPVEALDQDRPAYYDLLAEKLAEKIKGQPHAIRAITTWLSLQARGWVDQRRPRGRFVFAGPPGVGKTELALSLAEQLMHDRASVVVLNMGDYQDEMAHSKFMGATPGYVGFGATSTVYSRVMMRPFSVVVLDEIEKCHESLANPLLSILDGWAEDSKGNFVDFSQCIIVMTSNSINGASDTVASADRDGNLDLVRVAGDPSLDTAIGHLDEHLRRELLGLGGIWTAPLVDRIDRVCLFQPLGRAALLDILGAQIEARRRAASRHLPEEIDKDQTRLDIVAAATADGNSSSARRLERALLHWLETRAQGHDGGGFSRAVAVPHGVEPMV